MLIRILELPRRASTNALIVTFAGVDESSGLGAANELDGQILNGSNIPVITDRSGRLACHVASRQHAGPAIFIALSRAFRPMDEHLMPRPAFVALKSADKLGLGVQIDGVEYLSEVRQALDFNLKRLANRARNGKLEGVRLEAGKLIVSPLASEVPAASKELHRELSEMYPRCLIF